MVMFILFVLDWKYPFWENLVQNIKIISCWNLVPTIMVIIFWDFLMFYRISFSPQVKQSVIISNKHGISSSLTSYRTTWDLGSQEIRKHQEIVECRIQCCFFCFSVFDLKYLFWINLVQKIKIASLSWNVVLRLIPIWTTQWWC